MLARYGVGICLLFLDGKHNFFVGDLLLAPHRLAAAFRAISDLCSGLSFAARAVPVIAVPGTTRCTATGTVHATDNGQAEDRVSKSHGSPGYLELPDVEVLVVGW
jgi:hypothetical protein